MVYNDRFNKPYFPGHFELLTLIYTYNIITLFWIPYDNWINIIYKKTAKTKKNKIKYCKNHFSSLLYMFIGE